MNNEQLTHLKREFGRTAMIAAIGAMSPDFPTQAAGVEAVYNFFCKNAVLLNNLINDAVPSETANSTDTALRDILDRAEPDAGSKPN